MSIVRLAELVVVHAVQALRDACHAEEVQNLGDQGDMALCRSHLSRNSQACVKHP